MGAQGTAILDFGAFPGASDASVSITGQAGIVAGSLVEAWIRPVITVDHSADEHMLETLKVFAANIIAGTGFTIYGFNSGQLNEKDYPQLYETGQTRAGSPIQAGHHSGNYSEGRGTRIYGKWQVAWVWN
jgi:hypothetical protein